MMGLAACGGGDEATSGAAAPAATTTSAAAPAATEAAPAADAPDDKAVCEAANKASDSLKKAMLTLMQNGAEDLPPSDMKLLLTDFAKSLNEAAGSSDSKAGAAVKLIATQSTEAAAAADPSKALDEDAATKAGKDLNAACKAAGVTTNF
ncbi:hypothetical protein [Actinoplanes sp. G11-F43]|uniref:hypothetical protein n=1 Tax=Actinoplanes sp. G11-F43 TaxID=3424130 RepID=UPI003D34A2CC